jgi:organic hydroperoxide reductase OsmC/OhrA
MALRVMIEEPAGGGRFIKVVLQPQVTVAAVEMIERARPLHAHAHALSFIANSVNFEVRHDPTFKMK